MRDYDPTLGWYLQADPLGLVDGASVYGYALQNPGRYTDPTGREIPPGFPDPNSVIPGEWTYNPNAPRPGEFLGPKGPNERPVCQYVTENSVGNSPHRAYWKTRPHGGSWQRHNLQGQEITAEEAHPGNPNGGSDTIRGPRFPRIPGPPIFFFDFLLDDMMCPGSCQKA